MQSAAKVAKTVAVLRTFFKSSDGGKQQKDTKEKFISTNFGWAAFLA